VDISGVRLSGRKNMGILSKHHREFFGSGSYATKVIAPARSGLHVQIGNVRDMHLGQDSKRALGEGGLDMLVRIGDQRHVLQKTGNRVRLPSGVGGNERDSVPE